MVTTINKFRLWGICGDCVHAAYNDITDAVVCWQTAAHHALRPSAYDLWCHKLYAVNYTGQTFTVIAAKTVYTTAGSIQWHWNHSCRQLIACLKLLLTGYDITNCHLHRSSIHCDIWLDCLQPGATTSQAVHSRKSATTKQYKCLQQQQKYTAENINQNSAPQVQPIGYKQHCQQSTSNIQSLLCLEWYNNWLLTSLIKSCMTNPTKVYLILTATVSHTISMHRCVYITYSSHWYCFRIHNFWLQSCIIKRTMA